MSGAWARASLIGAAGLFSTGGAVIKATELTSWQVASLRSGLAGLVLLALWPAARAVTLRALAVSVCYAATLVLFVLATKLTTSASAIFLQSTAPLFILAASAALLRERIQRRDIGLAAVIGCGLVLLMLGNQAPQRSAPQPALGNALGLASGVAWALTLMGFRWLHARGEDATPAVAAGNLVAFATALPFALPIEHLATRDLWAIGYLGVFQISAAYLLVSAGIRRVPAFEASLLLLLEPLLNPVWTLLSLGETPGRWSLVGGGLILSATSLKSWLDLRSDAPNRATRSAETPKLGIEA